MKPNESGTVFSCHRSRLAAPTRSCFLLSCCRNLEFLVKPDPEPDLVMFLSKMFPTVIASRPRSRQRWGRKQVWKENLLETSSRSNCLQFLLTRAGKKVARSKSFKLFEEFVSQKNCNIFDDVTSRPFKYLAIMNLVKVLGF